MVRLAGSALFVGLHVLVFVFLLRHGSMAQNGSVRNALSELREQYMAYEQLSPLDTVADIAERIGSERRSITDRLILLLSDPRILSVDLDKELEGSIPFTRSNDRRLWHFMVPDRSGGTYRGGSGVMHWRMPDGQVFAQRLENTELHDRAFQEPMELSSTSDSYFTITSLRPCATCIRLDAVVVRLLEEGLGFEIIHSFEGRNGHVDRFEYYPSSRQFHYDHSLHPDDSLYGTGLDHVVRESGTYVHRDDQFLPILQCVHRE
jgi:hypothetical protein